MKREYKDPVRLRQKPARHGRKSLYLDTYLNGQRKYEFLHLFLEPELTAADRRRNAETLAMARAVMAQRIVELRNRQFDFKGGADSVRFFDYCLEVMNKRQLSEGSRVPWTSAIARLHAYEKNDGISLARIDRRWCEGYRKFLESLPINQNTRHNYFTVFRTIMNQAYRDELVSRNPMAAVANFGKKETDKAYLTVDELRQMIDTPEPDAVRTLFLFGCITGLRFSDIEALTWRDVSRNGDQTRITFRQQKTQAKMYLDINPQAVPLMGERGKDSDRVFPQMDREHANYHVKRWARRAGINKRVTFHSSRHTFAVMMQELTGDIYMVSKLLGHASVTTTQVYAKIVDKNRQAAVAMIPDLLK